MFVLKKHSNTSTQQCLTIIRYYIQIKFPLQKSAIFRKVKEIKELRGGVQNGTPHKVFRRLTQRLRKRAISGWKLTEIVKLRPPIGQKISHTMPSNALKVLGLKIYNN